MEYLQDDIVFKKIINAIAKKNSMALIRYGDGEYIVRTNGKHSYYKQNFMNHLGYMPSIEECAELAYNIGDSLEMADIVGITQNKGDIWDVTRDYFSNLARFKYTCDADIHHHLLFTGMLSEIFKVIEKLLIVSPHNLVDAVMKKYPHLEIHHIAITGENLYFKNSDIRHYPYVFNETMNAIKGMNLHGWTCMIGGGFVGKSYVAECKRRGGVALDLGSSMDKLAGYGTRGTGGKLVYDNTYKL